MAVHPRSLADSDSAIHSYPGHVTERIQQSELRNNNAEIMRRVADGESFTVTVHGRPVADIVPHRSARRRQRLVPAAALDEALAAAGPPPDAQEWARDMAEGEALLGDDRPTDPWEREQ
jgi:prevent-host-death family protein